MPPERYTLETAREEEDLYARLLWRRQDQPGLAIRQSLVRRQIQTTVGVKIDKKTVQLEGRDVTLMLWDVAGEEDDAPVKLSHIRGASGYLLVADGRRAKTLDAALRIQQRVEA